MDFSPQKNIHLFAKLSHMYFAVPAKKPIVEILGIISIQFLATKAIVAAVAVVVVVVVGRLKHFKSLIITIMLIIINSAAVRCNKDIE